MNNILITGGSGFIGTNLIQHLLLTNKFNIINIDINEPKVKEQKNIWENINLLEYQKLEDCIKAFSPTIVIHLGARTDLTGAVLEDYSQNIEGVQNLLNILDEVPSIDRVIFASSMYVCYPGYIPKNFDDYSPHTVYGESKVLTEKIIKGHNPKYCWSIIRPTSIWGPYFGEPYNLFFKIVLSKKYFHMGKRACNKTYGYIDNTIYQIMSILNTEKTKVDTNVFYLGDYDPYNITEWANEIADTAGFKIPNIPFYIFVLGGWFGDILKLLRIKFPMTSFRLKNMTTDNVHNLELIRKIAPDLPVSRKEGIKYTIKWLNEN